ncbi:MAG: hypothetical protein A3F17_02180 [Gammaproteobacteria bacterium RIFCSPHIGHO2_12_FULL_41_15]|nr:MAG: hypothetical protein A3F17_02180 [Gammaproteobacteria bacterium RIFCSPHIGHO2_12_FULL_41_15]
MIVNCIDCAWSQGVSVPIHIVILSSDILFWFLLLAIGLSFIWLNQQAMMRRPWLQVMASPVAAVCLVILLVYVGIALLDSIHFQYAEGQTTQVYTVQSVLDWIFSPLGEVSEKTYSSPFASTLYSKTVFNNAAGDVVNGFAPLKYVYQASGEADQVWHIISRSMLGAVGGLMIGILCIVLCLYWRSSVKKISFKAMCQSVLQGHSLIAARSLCLSVIVLSIGMGALYALSKQYHVLGTDKIGDDVFYETIKSIRTGVLIGSLTTVIMLPFALLFGMLAGFLGGIVDDIIQFTYTVLSSIPSVLLISASILALQLFINRHPEWFSTLLARADARLLALCAILGVMSWTGLCRLLRAETFKLRELDFVTAAKSLGVRKSRIILRHIFPNIFHILIITMVLDFSSLVLAEAVLSYVGVGVDPTTMSWGNMINSARLELAREPMVWWPLIAAMIFMFILVLALNLFADKVRDAFDPRMNS